MPVLEDHGDDGAAEHPHLSLGDLHQVVALDTDLARRHLAHAVGQQAHQRQSGGGLARTGLAHEAQGLALFDLEADAIDGVDHLAAGLVLDPEIPDLYGRGGVFRFRFQIRSLLRLEF